MSTALPTDRDLDARFSPLFQRIAAGAVAREQSRDLPFEAVAWLKQSGFTSLSIPQRFGGAGISLQQLFRQLIRLGEADSNLPQILRAHFSFIELRGEGDEATAQRWLPLLAAGQTVGSAVSERSATTYNSVVLSPDVQAGKPGQWRLNGTKYYSTGTLYAEWIGVAAHDERSDLTVFVPTDAPGVQRKDDWDGFGQRMTGSGTTVFENVPIQQEQILSRYDASLPRRNSMQTAFVQAVHLATLAGIARAALQDAVALVKGRTRTFGVPGQSEPRQNPLVQRLIGRIGALATSCEALVEHIARQLDALREARAGGQAAEQDYIRVEIATFEAQQIVLAQALEAATLLFEVGGASATSESRRLDRHWRNARTLASHNPASQREAMIGRYRLDGLGPDEAFTAAHTGNDGTSPTSPDRAAAQ